MNTDSAEIKKALREELRAEIEALPDDYLADCDERLCAHIVSLREFADARNIMAYHSVGREPGTLRIVKAALEAGKTVAFPLCSRGGMMTARAVKSLGELVPAVLGIPAPPPESPLVPPEALDMIIVPGLTFDRSFRRIGYGGGYYDRYLAGLRTFTVGLARERLLRERLPAGALDVAVKCIATENGVMRAGNHGRNGGEGLAGF